MVKAEKISMLLNKAGNSWSSLGSSLPTSATISMTAARLTAIDRHDPRKIPVMTVSGPILNAPAICWLFLCNKFALYALDCRALDI